MGFTGQKYGFFESKVWHFWVVTHGVLATPDNGLWLRRTTRQRVNETFASQDYKSTRLRDNKWGGSRWGFAGITESRIDGSTDLWILVSLRRTTDYGYALLRQTTSLRDNEWGGSRWSFAGITELWNYG